MYKVIYRETDDWGDTTVKILARGHEKKKVYNKFLDFLPDKVIHWSMRYDYWTKETLDKFLEIVPDMDKRPHIVIHTCYPCTFCDEDYGKEEFARYHLDYNYEMDDLDPVNEPLLTRAQKRQLVKLFKPRWMPSRHTSFEYEFVDTKAKR